MSEPSSPAVPLPPKPVGFKQIPREMPKKRPVELRVLDWAELDDEFTEPQLRRQGARCMDCGIAWCNGGCPLGNSPPEWNEMIYRGRLADALRHLHHTNNFPEFTGRVCPAPCEEACSLGLYSTPVTIRNIEKLIIDQAFEQGLVDANPPTTRTGKRVAVIGSGPAGLSCAAQLNKAGHLVTVFERADRVGGLLMYGIPSFKLEKHVVTRRVKLMEQEGVTFVTGADVGRGVSVEALRRDYDAIALCAGATRARDLHVPGRDLDGVHLAMTYLPQPTQENLGDRLFEEQRIDARGKHVLVLGGGDTGADCVGTAIRQGAASVRQIELMPRPPEERGPGVAPWPYWPMILRTSSSHEEAEQLTSNHRDWSILTKRFSGEEGRVRQLHAVRLQWSLDASGKRVMSEVPGSEFALACDLCLLALGFLGPETDGPIQQLGLKLDERGNVAVDSMYMTSTPGVFASGDARRGQSLVVWAMSEGRCCAHGIDRFLMGASDLPYLKLF